MDAPQPSEPSLVPQPRTKLFNVRMTDEEMAELHGLARQYTNGNLSKLIRLLVRSFVRDKMRGL